MSILIAPGDSVVLWDFVPLVDLEAGDVSPILEFRGSPLQAWIRFFWNVDPMPVLFPVDLEYSEAGNIWIKIADVGGLGQGEVKIPATPGYYRAIIRGVQEEEGFPTQFVMASECSYNAGATIES